MEKGPEFIGSVSQREINSKLGVQKGAQVIGGGLVKGKFNNGQNNSKSNTKRVETTKLPKQSKPGVKIYSGAKKSKRAKLFKKLETYALVVVTVATFGYVIKNELSKEDITIAMSETDTLSAIANDFDVPLENIVRDNGIMNPNNVALGQEINLTTQSENVDEYRDEYNIIYEEKPGKSK